MIRLTQRSARRVRFAFRAGLFSLLLASTALAQDPPKPAEGSVSQPAPASSDGATKTWAATPDTKNGAEISSRDTSPTFKVRVNLVLVRVVVRDEKGKVVEHLKKEDFLLFDNRKPQVISTFAVETPTSHVVPVNAVSVKETTEAEPVQPGVVIPQRFITLLFDDMRLSMSDAVNVRAAAGRIFNVMTPSDRISISTTSGQFSQDFTSDRELLKNSLTGIIARNIGGLEGHDCPDISYYQADLIENKNDDQALNVATQDALQCAYGGDQQYIQQARSLAMAASMRAVTTGDNQSSYAYRHIEDALRVLSGKPGQRTMVFISPGFILSSLHLESSGVIDRATRSNIIIDTLDARGLYTPDINGDIADPPSDHYQTAGTKSMYRVAAQSEQEVVMRDFAYGTGGTYYHNRNDLDAALREAIAAPPVSYLLGFNPQNLKLNGSFHTLKVSLTSKNKYQIQARRGYFSPRTMKNPADTAKEEIQEAVFSQEEMNDVPLNFQTQFFKKDDMQARLSVLAHVDVRNMRFRKAEGRNNNMLTLATAIFDQNGNFITGGEKILEMKLFDTTLDRLNRSGITVKSSFDVKPGTYLVRLVVRDAEGEQMSARNGAVVIPY